MNIHIRLETLTDHRAVEELTREAFWGFSNPTCDEHYLVHILRNRPTFVPELDYIAEVDGQLVGNVMYSKAKITAIDGSETEVLTFGPLSVLPSYWNKGVGSMLMRHSITEAKRQGFRAIVFYGHPDYYPRFGFRNAAAFGITTPDDKNFDALMAMPLYDNALDGVSGRFHEDEAFTVNAEEAEQYNLTFPFKEPATMIPIDLLLDRLTEPVKKEFINHDIKMLAWLNRLSGREMLQWDGVDEQTIETINQTLSEYGYSEKLLPSSYIFQLVEMGIRVPLISNIQSKDGIHVYRVESEGEKYILKTFDNPKDRREISNYKLLSALDIPTLPMMNYTETALLLPDVERSDRYRLGVESDMSDTRTARAVALWYKTLHDKGRKATLTGLYAETDVITLENIDFIAVKTNTQNNPFWQRFHERYFEIRCRIDALPYTLTYNDFYWTNLIVAKDYQSAMMMDFNLLGRGYIYSDIRNVSSSLIDEAKEAFLSEYGTDQILASEETADAVLSPLVTLYFACKLEKFPVWAEQALQQLKSGVLLTNLNKWR